MKRSPFKNALTLIFPLAIVACAQLQGLDDYEKVDCVDDGCDSGAITNNASSSSGGPSLDAAPDRAPTCEPCTDGKVCDQKSLKCVECLPGTKPCAVGQFCDPDDTLGFKCVQGCGTVQDCLVALGADAGSDAGGDGGAGTLACCNNRCVDTASDGKNCGACNVICGSSAACCNSDCQDIVSTPTSCGGCGITCSSNHVPAVSCGAKACNGACETGWADCNTNKLTDGCETAVSADPDKCGGCNTVCSNNHMQTRTCGAGLCNGACAVGFLDCNQNKQTDGCETNIDIDALNCGGCNKACSNNNVPTPTCAGGVCNGNCGADYSDCDGSKLVNGCETKTGGAGADVNNCGGCGASFKCSNNHVPTPTCNGTCNGACEAGWGDCDANKLTNGCETLISGNGANPDHCGACNSPCSSNHMATRTCNGTCTGTCDTGWGDCNNNKKTDGCEARVTSDALRCGATCLNCGAGKACVNGTCVASAYAATTSPASFIDACAQNGAKHFFATGLHDDENVQDGNPLSTVLTLPFAFTFYGVSYTQYTIDTNGYLGFGATAIPTNLYDPGCDSSATTTPVIWAFTDDLMTRASTTGAPPNADGGICTVTIGTQHVITWKTMRYYADPAGSADRLTFSVILNQNTNTIDVLFQTMDNGTTSPADTSYARVGVQSGTSFTNYACQESANVVGTGTKIRFFVP